MTRAALIRDVAVELGVFRSRWRMAGGASIDTAAIVHLSLGTPERLRLHTCDFHAWVTVDNADGMPLAWTADSSRPPGPRAGRPRARVDALGDPLGE